MPFQLSDAPFIELLILMVTGAERLGLRAASTKFNNAGAKVHEFFESLSEYVKVNKNESTVIASRCGFWSGGWVGYKIVTAIGCLHWDHYRCVLGRGRIQWHGYSCPDIMGKVFVDLGDGSGEQWLEMIVVWQKLKGSQ